MSNGMEFRMKEATCVKHGAIFRMKASESIQYIEIPKPERPTNPTPLEMIIYNYELEARKFHNTRNKMAPVNESAEDKRARIAKRDRDWQHLRVERRKIAAHLKLQTQLNLYREANKKRSAFELLAEDHHPTKKLARNLAAIGEAKPTTFHEPHHIIPGQGKYDQPIMEICRINLHTFGYGINDPVNGVWLRNFDKNKQDDWATPVAPSHRPIHTMKYESWISDQFLNDNLPEGIFINRLRSVKYMLKTGSHPDHILEKAAPTNGRNV